MRFKSVIITVSMTVQDTQYWIQRWRDGQVGFHQPEVNPYLRAHWDSLAVGGTADVFVPLCGKTLDLAWLSRRCGSVSGVELSAQALEEFFQEQGLVPERRRSGAHELWRCGRLQLFCGDFFALQPEQLPAPDLVYDRAALVALEPALRGRYVQKLLDLLAPHTRILLITLSYPQQAMAGPPYSVDEDELRHHFAERFRFSSLFSADVIDKYPRFADKGLDRLQESVLLLSPK